MRFPEMLASGLATVIVLVVFTAQDGAAIDNLRVVRQWKLLDYNWPDNETRQLFSNYMREENTPMGLEVAGNRLFITVPRWRKGVAATLNYIYLNDTSESPLLNPYPSWEAHKYTDDHLPELISVVRIRADRCNRLWVVDTGLDDLLGDGESKAQPSVTVYDLSNDQVLRKYSIPGLDRNLTHITTIAVEDASCEDSYAYLADSSSPVLIVYSWLRNESWIARHHFFHGDPLGGVFTVAGLRIQWWDGIVGLGLASRADGYSTLYFNAVSSLMQFYVDTKILRNPEIATQSLKRNFFDFKYLGSRGDNGQSLSCFVHPTTGVLFQVMTFENYIACWKPGMPYNRQNLGRVYGDYTTLVIPSDIKIDPQDNMWVLSNQLAAYFFAKLNPDVYNFRIFTGTVAEAVKGTTCAERRSDLFGLGGLSLSVGR